MLFGQPIIYCAWQCPCGAIYTLNLSVVPVREEDEREAAVREADRIVQSGWSDGRTDGRTDGSETV